jgi:ParB-like chromosome segregation protein Spo0J
MARGRKAHKPTEDSRNRARELSGYGMTRRDIAFVLGVSEPTLNKHYAADLDEGRATARGKVTGKLFEKAMSGDTASILFYLKTQLGWREKQDIELSGPGGEPLKPVTHVELIGVRADADE